MYGRRKSKTPPDYNKTIIDQKSGVQNTIFKKCGNNFKLITV